ncbi:MAG: M20/M25/M40 family metallo-hydrolase [Mariniphaga sp.]|nr:M20/M25/M40 family metallo-hydrolase [Mariniphaga sp.]
MANHINFLSSDSLQGRGFSSKTPALEITADYLVATIEKSDLQYMGKGYSQKFALFESGRDEENTFLKIFGNKKEKVFSGNEFALFNQKSEVVEMEGELIFAGFGWNDENSDFDELAGLELKNKVVLISAGTPESFQGEFSHHWNNSLERNKTDKIFHAGARAVILITSVQDKENKTFNQISRRANRPNYSLEKTSSENETNLVIATPDVADAILGKKGRWKKTLQKIAKKGKPVSFVSKNKIQLKSAMKVKEKKSRNIIGFVEGSDPVLKEECVVFMAHYDHLGMTKNGEIYNGADDNASGTATLLEVARAFTLSEEKPKRSIVFLWVTAEEVGLIGSEYYSKNPVFPLEKTVACINLDMVGRVYEPRDSVWAHSPKQVKPFHEIYALVNDFDPNLKKITEAACLGINLTPDFSLPERFFYSSDHYHFHRNKVPVLNLSTGYTADYHKVTDVPERINYDKIKKVAELCYLVGFAMANN